MMSIDQTRKRIWCLALLLSLRVLSCGEEVLPKITPAVVSEIQRLAITIRLSEFPLTQQEYEKHLALPAFTMALNVGGKEIRSHAICVLTDQSDPLGYYGFNLYWGKNQAEAPYHPLVEEIELFFEPGNLGNYPPVRAFVLPKDTPETSNPNSLAFLRAKMRERHLSPGEFVKEWYNQKPTSTGNKPSSPANPAQSVPTPPKRG